MISRKPWSSVSPLLGRPWLLDHLRGPVSLPICVKGPSISIGTLIAEQGCCRDRAATLLRAQALAGLLGP